MEKYLCHHGILGMKWGVRRYQNENGTLTTEGRERYNDDMRKIKNSGIREQTVTALKKLDEQKNSLGVSSKNLNEDVIKKNSEFKRIANTDEPLDNKRKYVSMLRPDIMEYESAFEELPLDQSKSVSQFTYKAKKNLMVVTGKKVANDIMEKYGNNTIKEMYEDLLDIKEVARIYNKPTYDTDLDVIDKYYRDSNDKVIDFFASTMKEHGDEILEYYKNKHYDAIVDVEDWIGTFCYPLILIDPKNSVELVKKEEFY